MHNQALHACIALSQDCETVRLLLEQGADVNMAQAGGYTPLHQAAANGRADLVGILLEAGANPATLCHRGKAPADYALERRHEAVVQLLSTARV
jgi:ankyrin repeat protein